MGAIPMIDFASFAAGTEVRFGHAVLRFEDDAWPLTDMMNDPALERSKGVIDFTSVAAWLRPDVKRWIASLWLEQSRSVHRLDAAIKAARQMSEALTAAGFAGPASAVGRPESLAVQAVVYDAARYERGTMDQRRTLINQLAKYLRESYPESASLREFRVKVSKSAPPRRTGRAYGLDLEKIIPLATRQQLLGACAAEEQAYEVARERVARGERLPDRGMKLNDYLARAIKAQALKVFLATGRRANSIVRLPVRPRWERSTDPQAPGVTLYYHETKITDAPHHVFAPHEYGDILVDALEKAERYGAAMRAAVPLLRDYLFLIPGASGGPAAVLLKTNIFNQYLRYRKYREGELLRDTGLLARYGITGVDGDIAEITSHNFRHTRTTTLFGATGSSQVATQDLGHVSPDMAVKHYIGTTPEVQATYDIEMAAGAVRLSQQATINSAEIVDESLTPEMASRKTRKGIVLQPTRFGFCTLTADDGPCPTSNPCYVGINPDRVDAAEGCGCKHQALAPHARQALEEDLAVHEQNVEAFSANPATKNLADHFAVLANIARRQLVIIDTELQPKLRAHCARGCEHAG